MRAFTLKLTHFLKPNCLFKRNLLVLSVGFAFLSSNALAARNLAPVVDAGADQTISLPQNQTQLNGTATDDFRPINSAPTIQWSTVSGPGSVTFSNPAALNATATFSVAGSYVLQLEADDGRLSSTDTMTVTINTSEPPPPPPPPPGSPDLGSCPIGHDNVSDNCIERDSTFYVATSGSDSNTGSPTSPWKTIAHGLSTMSGGDTLVIKSGTYNESITNIPDGGAGNYTVILAEDLYNTVISGESLSSSPLNIKNGQHHIHVQGIHFRGPMIAGSGGAVANIGEFRENSNETPDTGASDITIYRNIFQGGNIAETNIYSSVVVVGVSQNILLEENATFGKANKYHFQLFRSSNITVRRNLVRWDAVNRDTQGSGHPASSYTFYDTSNSTFENNLALDGQHTSTTTSASYYIPAHYIGCSNNKFLGNIALNNAARVGVEIDPGGNFDNLDWKCNNQLIENNVLWNSAAGAGIGINTGQSEPAAGYLADVVVNRNTVGNHNNNGRGLNIHHNPPNINFTNNAVISNGRVANNSESTLNLSYTMYYNNSQFVTGNGTDNLSNNIAENPELVSIVEPGAAAENKASDGGTIGATVLKRYQDGVLTNTDLWPWPNEALLKQKLCDEVGETRGFCSATSITEYIKDPSHLDTNQ